MTFEKQITEIAETIPNVKDQILNEEATKNSLILPFINALGYNVFNPTEVLPEFIADVGMKKGERVDYAVCIDSKPVFLYECKWCQSDLSNANAAQLRRYFHVTSARIGILTNGIQYQFFSDLDESNIMDEKPFMELDLENIDTTLLKEVKKLSKPDFEIDAMLSTANDLKYIRQIRALIQEQFADPSPEFVKFFTSQVYPKRITPTILEQFTAITKKALKLHINSEINQRLTSALSNEDHELTPDTEVEEILEQDDKPGIVTTEEEMEGFFIVKAIMRKTIPPERIFHRDTKSYFGVLLDNNNRKPICRLHFNRKQKYIGIFDTEKKETRHPIESLNDIYNFSDSLHKTIDCYESANGED
ncbi:type I restriction endonuclease [Desulfobacter sp.]